MPQKLDGQMIEPHVSEPRAKPTRAADTAAPEPDDEPQLHLGGGYDSPAYRFHDGFPATRFFELDYPAPSACKQAKVAALFDRRPDHVTYLAVDLIVQSLGAALVSAGYDGRRRTLFIWEGVTIYLPLAAVDETLAFVARQSGPGSSIVFDHIFRHPRW